MAEERGKTFQSQMLTVEMHFLKFDVGHSLFFKWRNENIREEFKIFKLTITFDIQKPVNFAYGMDGTNLCVSKDANCDVFQKKEMILKIELV
jgi:hypothetical protein